MAQRRDAVRRTDARYIREPLGDDQNGGSSNIGTIFRITPRHGLLDQWTFAVEHSFTGNGDGIAPQTTVAVDSSGNAYGTTLDGGTANMGTVYEFVP